MARKKLATLPEIGDAFAFPLADGRLSVCRVLLDATSTEAKNWGHPVVCVAVSTWIGTELPTVDDPALRPILHLNHHLWSNVPSTLWVSEQVPSNFTFLGKIEPTDKEQALAHMAFGRWDHLAIQPLAQWRWDHERDVVLAEDRLREKAEAERRHVAEKERAGYLSRVTLQDLRTHRFFPRWKAPPDRAVRASRELMAYTVQRLLEMGSSASGEARMAVLQECIEAFNSLDAELDFIETVEREDICEEFEAVVHACGLGGHQDLADRWREW
jgi:hypothetical protein